MYIQQDTFPPGMPFESLSRFGSKSNDQRVPPFQDVKQTNVGMEELKLLRRIYLTKWNNISDFPEII